MFKTNLSKFHGDKAKPVLSILLHGIGNKIFAIVDHTLKGKELK